MSYCSCSEETYCLSCAAKDGQCECICDCSQCLYTKTPCSYMPEGLCQLCVLREKWASQGCACYVAAQRCDDCVTEARNVSPIRIPSPSPWEQLTPMPMPIPSEFCEEPEFKIEDAEALAQSVWNAGVKVAGHWVQVVKGLAWSGKT
jgi:hypothetical protein